MSQYKPITNYYDRFLTWMVCFYFLLSASIFSGYTGKSSVTQLQNIATCWNYNNNYHKRKRAVSYKKAARLCTINTANGHADYKFALNNYNNFIRVKLAAARSIFNATRPAWLFTRNLFIPEKATADPFIAVTA